MSFSDSAQMTIIQIKGALYTFSAQEIRDVPEISFFDLAMGYNFRGNTVESTIVALSRDITDSPEGNFTMNSEETPNTFEERKHQSYEPHLDQAVKGFVDLIQFQWLCEMPLMPASGRHVDIEQYIDIDAVNPKIRAMFKNWYSNLLLRQSLDKACNFFKSQPKIQTEMPTIPDIRADKRTQNSSGYIPARKIFETSTLSLKNDLRAPLSKQLLVPEDVEADSLQLLNHMIHQIESVCAFEYEKIYLTRLRESLESLHQVSVK